MSLIDTRCLTCGSVQEVVRAARDWPSTPACPQCGSPTEQLHLPREARTLPPAVVVYQASDGSYRFPGDSDAQSCQKYERLGFRRIEARGFAEVRSLQGRLNTHERIQAERQAEKRQEAYEQSRSVRRSEVRRRVQSFTAGGQAFARTLLDHMDRTDRPPQAHDPGVHIEAYEYDRSNRQESRRPDGKRHRD